MWWVLWGAVGLGFVVMGLIALGRNDARVPAQKAFESNDAKAIEQALASYHMPREMRARLEQRLKELRRNIDAS